jgi:hypothetical protein
VEQVFIAFGVLFVILYVVIALIRTVRRKVDIVRTDVILAVFAALIPFVGLVVAGLDGISDTQVELSVLIIAGVMAGFGLLFTIVELFRPQRLKQSRGILTLGISVLLALASVFVPFSAAYFSLPPVASPVAVVQATPDSSEDFFVVFNDVIGIVGEAAGLSQDEVLSALDNGQTVAELVEANNGDLEQVIDEITRIMQEFLRMLVARDEVDPLRASAGIAGMEVVVRYAVNNDLRSLQRAGEENSGTITPQPTAGEGTPRESFFAFLTASFTPQAEQGEQMTSVPDTSTPLPTITPPPTARSSATRTPRPTATVTPTRERFATRTPTLTPTLPSPCLAQAEYNVNIRAEPDTDSALVTTIPFETVVNVFGRNEDSTWWYVEYEGNAGWVNDEFVTETSSCNRLPVRE